MHSTYKFFQKNPSKTFPIFFRKCDIIKIGTCKFEAKTQKQTIFRPNLFGNFYSTLNFLSNGVQYSKLIILKKEKKKLIKPNKKNCGPGYPTNPRLMVRF